MSTVSSPDPRDETSTIAELKLQVAEMRADIARLARQLDDIHPRSDYDQITVAGNNGAIEIGRIGEHHFGIKVIGRGSCAGLSAILGVDDGAHSLPVVPHAIVDVSGAGSVQSCASNLPMHPPATVWLSDLDDRTAMTFLHDGYADDLDGPPDTVGSWSGRLDIADGTT